MCVSYLRLPLCALSLHLQIAQLGMRSIIKVIEHYDRDPEFLTRCFRLIGHLAFVEANLKVIVQYNGIQVCVYMCACVCMCACVPVCACVHVSVNVCRVVALASNAPSIAPYAGVRG
jgi:hypothetical protein